MLRRAQLNLGLAPNLADSCRDSKAPMGVCGLGLGGVHITGFTVQG